MDAHEKYTALRYLEKAWEEINKLQTPTPCLNCQHLSAGFCNHWKEAVPHDILPKGCEKWKFDEASPPA